ncbi:hypothetical protein JCM11491_001503 [Sporobolomyces phaffii]
MIVYLVAVATLASRVLARDIPITAESSVAPGARLALAWSSDTPTFTVRVIVNKAQVDEIRSIPDPSYSWTATDVKPGDQVQFWVYDSAGNAGKTEYLPVVNPSSPATPEPVHPGGEPDEVGTEVDRPIGPVSSTSTRVPISAGTATGAADSTSDTGAGVATSSPVGGSELSVATLVSNSSVATGSTPPISSPRSTGVTRTSSGMTASSSTSASSSSEEKANDHASSSSSDKTVLYLGIGAVVLAAILAVAFFLWWRQRRQRARHDGPGPNASSKKGDADAEKGHYAPAAGHDDDYADAYQRDGAETDRNATLASMSKRSPPGRFRRRSSTSRRRDSDSESASASGSDASWWSDDDDDSEPSSSNGKDRDRRRGTRSTRS